jgi:hypothetical protein
MLFKCKTTTGKGKALIGSFLIFLILVFSNYVTGQTPTLPVNGEGMVEYTGLIDTDSLSYLTLWDNAMKYLNTLSVPDQLTKDVQVNEKLTEMSHQFGFYLIVKPALTKQVDGVMMADIIIGVKDSKYEYTINNFRFIKYARDRYGVFVPKSSKKYPLEKYYPGNKKKTWQAHFEAIDSKIEKLTTDLEGKMIEIRKF